MTEKRKKLFGTDGIRGVANCDPMTAEMALRVGKGIASIVKGEKRHNRILIGKDTRVSGYMLENALTAGICSMGVDIFLVGPLPTPAIAFLTVSMRSDAGVVISASHNSFQDNGIKIFNWDGFKLPDDVENKIEDMIFSPELGLSSPRGGEIGKAFRIDDAAGRYIMFLKYTFPKHLTLEGMKIVLDCANGAAYKVGPAVFEELGAKVIPLGIHPDGENINLNCGSLYPQKISDAVRQHQAHIGIALDGDGDRVIFVDEYGKEVDGDQILAICAKEMIKNNTLNKNTLVATIMSNVGLQKAVESFGGILVKTQVGDRYVVEELRRGGYNLGGEKSGHLVFLDYNTTCDGILTALQILNVMLKNEKPLSELSRVMQIFPQILISVDVAKGKDIGQFPAVSNRIQKAEKALKGKGRVVVRPSGTESKIRVMVEGENEGEIKLIAEELADVIKHNLA